MFLKETDSGGGLRWEEADEVDAVCGKSRCAEGCE